MKLRELLLSKPLEIPSKEIKQRISNKQIKINNVPITNVDIDIEFEADMSVEAHLDLGTFLTLGYVDIDRIELAKKVWGIDCKDYFGPREEFPFTNGGEPSYLTPLHDYTLLSLSKTEHLVFKS